MAKSATLLRAFIRAAVLRADELGGAHTPRSVLKALILGRFSAEATNGRTLISTQEAGGAVSFVVPEMLGAAGIMELAEEALEWLEATQDDPDDPDLGQLRPTRRLRATFDHQMPGL
jgi:hypothetical protein